jgi:predicted nucleic acid-binding protein
MAQVHRPGPEVTHRHRTREQGFFAKHQDHAWSFTDCVSFVVMKERKASRALTKDERFREAGFVPLLG